MENLNATIAKYLKFVFHQNLINNAVELNQSAIDEFLEDKFKHIAVNDWKNGYNFVDWLKTEDNGEIDYILDINLLCEVISIIQSYFGDNYGNECLMDYSDLTPKKVLLNYAYVYLYGMDLDELKTLIGLIGMTKCP